jgi:hypothetical protein
VTASPPATGPAIILDDQDENTSLNGLWTRSTTGGYGGDYWQSAHALPIWWDKGFWPEFGLVEVDRATFKRTIRPSTSIYKQIIL